MLKRQIPVIAVLFFLMPATVFAQSIAKSLAFAQIAGGGVWESIINVTNRGTTAYTGLLSLYTMSSDGSSPQPWNPIVNGNGVTNGQVSISIPPGNTRTITITAPSLQAGFGTITPTAPSNTDETSFVEGTLTYYFLSGKDIVDSVGVEPSSQIYLTTIPFDDISSIALALANANAATTSVNLTVYSASSQVLGTATLPLAGKAHVAKYLNEIFPDVQGSPAGRLDIECDIPIYGVALTQVGGQFSSLPFQPAVKAYTWTENFAPTGTVTTGTLSARLRGSLAEYQKTVLAPVQQDSRYIGGTYTNGTFSTVDFDQSAGQVKYWTFNSFSFSMPTVVGTVQIYSLTPQSTYLGQGTVTLTTTGQTNPQDTLVAEHALAQTGLAMGQASTVMQSQYLMVLEKLTKATSCDAIPGGGSILVGSNAITVYYDSNCKKPYVAGIPTMTPVNAALSISETATYYGLNGTNLGVMTLNETADFGAGSGTISLYGLGTFTAASSARTPAQLGMYCMLNSSGTGQCAGGIVQDFPELGLAIGAITPLTLAYNPESWSSPMTFTGGGSVVAGPIGSLTLTNPSPTSLVIQGGTAFTSTVAGGGAAEFALFPPTPTAWTLTDNAHDAQLQISVDDDATRTLTVKIKRLSTGSTLATGTLDQSGSGTITWSDGSTSMIINWVQETKQ